MAGMGGGQVNLGSPAMGDESLRSLLVSAAPHSMLLLEVPLPRPPSKTSMSANHTCMPACAFSALLFPLVKTRLSGCAISVPLY